MIKSTVKSLSSFARSGISSSTRLDNPSLYHGLTRAVVVNTKDTDYNIGRIQVRVNRVHGIKNNSLNLPFIDDDDLPWAVPIMPYVGHNAGSIMIPEVGSTVWVICEDNDPNKLVYLGGMYGKHTEVDRKIGKSGIRKRTQDVMREEIPLEFEKDREDREDMYVVFKSPKGAVNYTQDYDGDEEVGMKSHLGEVLLLVNNMNSTDSDFNYKYDWEDVRKKPFNKWQLLKDGFTELIYKSACNSLLSVKSWINRSLVRIHAVTNNQSSQLNLESGSRARADLHLSDGTGIFITPGHVRIVGDLSVDGSISVSGSVHASGSIIDAAGNTNHHGH